MTRRQQSPSPKTLSVSVLRLLFSTCVVCLKNVRHVGHTASRLNVVFTGACRTWNGNGLRATSVAGLVSRFLLMTYLNRLTMMSRNLLKAGTSFLPYRSGDSAGLQMIMRRTELEETDMIDTLGFIYGPLAQLHALSRQRSGEIWNCAGDETEHSVSRAGAENILRKGQAKCYRIVDHAWLVEDARGAIPAPSRCTEVRRKRR